MSIVTTIGDSTPEGVRRHWSKRSKEEAVREIQRCYAHIEQLEAQQEQRCTTLLETLAKIAESEDIAFEACYDDHDGPPTRFEQDISEDVARWIRGNIGLFTAPPAAVPESLSKKVIDQLKACQSWIGGSRYSISDDEMDLMKWDSLQECIDLLAASAPAESDGPDVEDGPEFEDWAERSGQEPRFVTIQSSDPEDERGGYWLSLPDHNLLSQLAPGTRLYIDAPAPAAAPEPNNAAAEALRFYYESNAEDVESFLRLWYEGDFDTIRAEWPEAPEEVFIGADPLHPETRAPLTPAPAPTVTTAMTTAGMAEWDRRHEAGERDWTAMLEAVFLAMVAAGPAGPTERGST